MKKELKIIGLSLLIGMGISLVVAARMYAYAEKTQADIANNVIRFHVKANSDSPGDQDVKNAVRDRVLRKYEDELSAAATVGETKRFLTERMDELIFYAEQVVREWGYDYPVTAAIGTYYFPTRVYGDVVFPPGEYEALRVIIGEGAGSNWWCLLFPPLCYVDVTREIPEKEKQQLMYLLPEEGYQLLTHMSQDDSVKVKFKIVEWWQNRKEPAPETEGQFASLD